MARRTLVLSVSGIGNTILQSPLIKAIASDPRYELDVLFGSGAMASVLGGLDGLKGVYTLPRRRIDRLALVRVLRANQYEVSVAAFPSNRPEFHVVPYVLGIPMRVAHAYDSAHWYSATFLSTHRVPARRALHDVEQNLALLEPLGIDPARVPRTLTFSLGASDIARADEFAARKLPNAGRLVGLHAGCKKSESYRRWPVPHFVHLVDSLNARGIACVLFAGPDEVDDVRRIYTTLSRPDLSVVAEGLSLGVTAGLIRRCDAFLSTDSGLGHVAAALGVETIALFGPAQWSRTAPYGPNGHVLTLQLSCSPCLKYPFDASHSRINCPYSMRCLRELSPEHVLNELLALLA